MGCVPCASVPSNVSACFHLPLSARLLPTLGFALGATLAALPASGLDLPSLRSDQSPLFSADVSISVDTAGTPGLSLTVSLAYPELQWVRVSDGYAARFEVLAVFEPAHAAAQYGDDWQRRLRVSTFDQTTAYASTVVERRMFSLPAGRYRLRVRVRDLNTALESAVSEPFEVPDYSKVPLALADLELGVMGPDGQFAQVPGRKYGYDSARLAARVSVVDRRDGDWPRSYTLRYRILGESGDELTRGDRSVSLPHAGMPVILRPDSAAWFVGTYTFALELEVGRSHWRTDRTFEVEESGPPRGAEFKRMLEPLGYVADPGEIDELAHAPESEQAAAWEAFWKRRDPSPGTPRNEALIEFLRRIRYAEQHFQHFGPGWRSDMGRIYIKYGPPDQIENRPATVQSPPLEIWYYSHPFHQFVFADREGFGRFALVSPGGE